jgi:hypothetical protein
MISERDLPVLHSRSTASPQLDRSILPRMYPGFAPAWWRDFPAIWHRFCTGSSPAYPQVIHRVIQPITPDPYTAYPPVLRSRAARGAAEQATALPEDDGGGVVAGAPVTPPPGWAPLPEVEARCAR